MNILCKYLVILLMALLTAGCGRREADSIGAVPVITIWAHEGQPAEKKALHDIVEAFNREREDIVIRLEFKQEQGYGDRVNAAAIAGQLPDILDVDGPYTAHFAELGVLRPLTRLLPPEFTKDFLPTIIRQGTYHEELYTLGAFESTVVLFYDRAKLAECGITPPTTTDEAWTWDELMAALAILNEKYPDILTLETFLTWGGEWLSYAFMPLIWSNDGRVLSPDGARAEGYLNAPAAVEAMEAWQQLFVRGYADPSATPDRLQRAQAIMALGVFNRWPIYDEAGIDFGMSPYPGLVRPVSPTGSWCWGITSGCRNPAAAAEVLQWLLDSRESIPAICNANGGVPARVSALEFMPEYKATRGLFVEQLRKTGRARPATPVYGTLTTEFSRALDDIARGAEVQSALDIAARRVDAVLAGR